MVNILEKGDLVAGIPKKSAIDKKDALSKEWRQGYVAAQQEQVRKKIAEELGALQEGKAELEQGMQQLLALNAQIESKLMNAGAFPPPQGAGFPPPEAGGLPPQGGPPQGIPQGQMPPGMPPMGGDMGMPTGMMGQGAPPSPMAMM